MLEVRDLTIGFRLDDGVFTAVEAISFSLGEGETLAIVGESGSGKSVTALALTRLLPEPPALYQAGDILLDGHSILGMSEKMLRSVRGNQVAYIFQEPATSLNPVFSIYEQIASTTPLGRLCQPEDVAAAVAFLLSSDADYITGELIHATGGTFHQNLGRRTHPQT